MLLITTDGGTDHQSSRGRFHITLLIKSLDLSREREREREREIQRYRDRET